MSANDSAELTPDAIAGARFVKSLRGYNRDDVESFLRGVAADYKRVLDELRSLREEQDAAGDREAAGVDRGGAGGNGSQPPGAPSAPSPARSPGEDRGRAGGSFNAIPAASVVTGESAPGRPGSLGSTGSLGSSGSSGSSGSRGPVSGNGAGYTNGSGPLPPPPAGTGALVLAGDTADLPHGEVGAAVAAIFLRADEDSWRVREDAEHHFDRLRHQVSIELAEAGERAAELRRKARETASEMMDSHREPNEIASEVSLLLAEADKMASQVVERATSRARQLRRAAFSGLVDAEMQARQVVAEAQDDATSLLRMVPVPGSAGARSGGTDSEGYGSDGYGSNGFRSGGSETQR